MLQLAEERKEELGPRVNENLHIVLGLSKDWCVILPAAAADSVICIATHQAHLLCNC